MTSLLLFAFERPGHQIDEGFAGVLFIIEDLIDLIKDRHLDVLPMGQLAGRESRGNTLGHHPHAADDARKRFPFAQLGADMPISTEPSRAGEDKVSYSGQSRERLFLRTEIGAEPGDLGQPPRHQGGAGVGPELEGVADPGRDGDDVLEGAPDFHSDHIVARVDPER